MRPLTPFRRVVLLWLVFVATLSGRAAWADAARKQCIKACKSDRTACLTLAGGRKKALAAECTGTGATRKQCLGAAKHVFTVARKSCATLLGDCRACCKANGHGPTCPVGHPLAFDPPPSIDLTAQSLPTAASGRPLLLAVPGAQLEIDATKRDALTALGHCARWITACVVTAHSLDDCARSAPLCASDRPWDERDECCAPSCFERFQEARRAGAAPLAAFQDVFYGTSSCMPGVQALLQAGRP